MSLTIAAVCPTYLRPGYLGAAVDCFMRQTHDRRRLVVLDDAGQYEPQRGDRWELLSTAARYPSLGAKRNAVAEIALADSEVGAIAIMDDDEFYFPHWLESIAAALSRGSWCVATLLYIERPPGELTVRYARHRLYHYHPAWGISRSAWEEVGGYDPAVSSIEDTELYGRLRAVCGPPVDATPEAERRPYLLCAPRYPGLSTTHISTLDPVLGYEELARLPDGKATLRIGPLRDFAALPVRPGIVDE